MKSIKITDAQTLIKLFRSCVGRHIVTYLKDLPNYSQLTTIKQLLDTVENRYKKAVNVHGERLNFRSIGINPGESLLDYESRLNSFSKSCEFQNYDRDSAHLEMVLIAAPQKIKEKLLLTPDLTLDIAKNILKTMEVGSKWANQASSIKLDNNNDVKIKQEVNLNLAKRDKQKGSYTSEAGGSRKRFACSRCGSNRHASNDKACPALGKKCNNCSLTGHFAQYCKTKASRIDAELAKSSKKATASKNPRQCNNIQANANDSNEENSDSSQIYSVATINKIDVKHKYMEVRLNGMPIKMLVDSGSNVTIVTAEVFNKIKFKGHKLALSAEKLMDCQSKEIPVLGEYSVEAQIGKDKFREKVLVMKLDKCLLGNSFITKMKNFDWNNFLTNSSELECNQINDTRAKLEELKNEFSDIFKENPQSKVKGKLANFVLKKDAVPKFLPARTVPIAIEKQVDAEIEKMVKQGYWIPVSQSKWATPLVPVPKKDGGVRICGDYKPTVNTQIEIAHHPLPTVELITSKLSGITVLSKIDLNTAFQQLELDEASKELCTVNTNKGLFEVNRQPFGVASSPALWQRTMDSILINLPGVCCFVNDILVAAKTETEHLNRLKAVFKRLQENDVPEKCVKPEKCVFMTKEISYLGFKITDKGLFKTDEKIKAIKESLAPTNVSEVRSFLGLVTFYSKFVPNVATTAAPIYQLTHKNVAFDWNEECQKAFQSLKQELISNRFLTYFNPKLPLIVSCDASPVGLGAVLAHKLPSGEEKPIAYASRTLSNSERNYSQIDKESLAIIFAVKHFHFFLYGKDRFTIYTDHKPLISLFVEHAKLPTLVAARLQRWALTLSAYNYKIEYRTGTNNGNADALSRKPLVQTNLNAQIDGTINNVLNIETIPFTVTYDEIVRETRKDRILSVVYDSLLKGREFPQSAEFLPYQRVKDQLNIDKECVLKANRVIVPVKLKGKVMQMLHSEHMGISKTMSLARYYVWWPKIDEDIENLVKTCEPCQLNRNDPEKHSSHSWQYPSNPWERIHIDFCGPFRNHMYLIVVDAYSKWPEVTRMSSSNIN